MTSNLVTNRTEGHVSQARELNKKVYSDMYLPEKMLFDNGIGAYRPNVDMNRVGEACAELYAALTEAGYAVSGYVALKTDWTDTDRPTKAQFNTYLATVAAIKAALPTTTPLPTTMKNLTTTGANNIEKLLGEVDSLLFRLRAIYVRSGEYNSGAVLYPAEGDLELKGCVCFYIPVEYDYHEAYQIRDQDGQNYSQIYYDDEREQAVAELFELRQEYPDKHLYIEEWTIRIQRTFKLSATKAWNGTLEYSTNKDTWQTWNGAAISGSKIYLRGTGNTKIGGNSSYRFRLTGEKVGVTGNIENLLDYQTVVNGNHPTAVDGCFNSLFYGETSIVDASGLLLTLPTVPENGYRNMFTNCTALKSAPRIDAIEVNDYGCLAMFYACSSLIDAPSLPATSVGVQAYYAMFKGCTSLCKACPVLPAEALAASCYAQMFFQCQSLIMPPKILATSTAEQCCASMFQECAELAYAPALYSLVLATRCYYAMFYKCDKIKIRAMGLGPAEGYNYTWRVPITGTGTSGTNSLSGMFTSPAGTSATPAVNQEYYATFPSI